MTTNEKKQKRFDLCVKRVQELDPSMARNDIIRMVISYVLVTDSDSAKFLADMTRHSDEVTESLLTSFLRSYSLSVVRQATAQAEQDAE